MEIKVVGPGCARCHELHRRVINACAALDLDADIRYITDIKRFPELGVMFTPALLVNSEMAVQGKLPEIEEIKTLLAARRKA
jgi:small redox-active disulfide protein 2